MANEVSICGSSRGAIIRVKSQLTMLKAKSLAGISESSPKTNIRGKPAPKYAAVETKQNDDQSGQKRSRSEIR